MKRSLAWILTAVLALGCMTGIAATAQEEMEPYEIEIVTNSSAFTNSADTEIGAYIQEHFGITFKNVYYSGDIREKQSMALAAGDYGELVYLQRNDMVSNYIGAGALLSLEPYLDSMPNFTKRYASLLDTWRGIGGGTLYKWEAYVPTDNYEGCDMVIRSDLLEMNDWKAPVSTSEWIDLLKRALAEKPTTPDGLPAIGMTLPLAEPWGLQGLACALYEKGDHQPALGNEGYIFDTDTDSFTDYFLNPDTKDSLAFFNELYRDGILDPECFTDLSANTLEKMQTGQAMSVFYVNWNNTSANSALMDAGLDDLQYVNVYIQTDKQVANGEKRLFKVESSRPFDSYAMTTKCRFPERITALLDWAASDDGQHYLQEGPEGDLWEINEEGVRVPTQKRLDMTSDEGKAYGLSAFPWLGITPIRMADGQYFDLMQERKYIDANVLTDRQKEVYANMGWEASDQWAQENGLFYPTGIAQSIQLDSTTDFGKTQQKMVETRVKWSAKLILAESADDFEQIYEEAVAEYDLIDHQSVIDEMNRLYQEAKKNG